MWAALLQRADQGDRVMDRRTFLTRTGAVLRAAPLAADAQQTAKVPRIGFLGLASASSLGKQVEALRAGLRDLGYLEGKNVVIDYRWAEGKYDRLSDLAGGTGWGQGALPPA